MGELYGLKGTQSNTLCSGFVDKTLSWGFWKLFSTGTYAIIVTTCVKSENVMKSTMKKNSLSPRVNHKYCVIVLNERYAI